MGSLKTSDQFTPLFSVEDDLTNFYDYINHFKVKIKSSNTRNIHVLKNKKDVETFL